ncbi:MAG: hypothetical protein ACREH8_02010 [Opitutaceae bacterium]
MSMLAAIFSRAEIGIGDSRDEVLRQTGKPTSRAKRGDHEIFLYPKGGRVELIGGKVVDVKGPLPTAPAQPVETSAPATAQNATEVPAANRQEAVAPTPPESGPPVMATRDEYNPAEAANELAKHVEKMDTAWGVAPARQEVHSPLDSLPAFLTGLLLRFLLTIFALKLACKYWEMDAFWSGIFMIAGIDMALHAMFELLGPASGGFTTLVAVENGVPGLVMIYTIYRFCFNKRIPNALITAASVKLVVTLCHLFLAVGAMNLIFG